MIDSDQSSVGIPHGLLAGCGSARHLHGGRDADKVEGATYSSVMITGNFRQAIEGAFTLVAGDRTAGLLRKSCIFMSVCAAFGTGAAGGALLTERIPSVALGMPVAALLMVLMLCAASPAEAA